VAQDPRALAVLVRRLDVTTELPVLVALLRRGANGPVAGRCQLRRLKKAPKSSSRMGYRPMPTGAGAKHILFVFFITKQGGPGG